MSLNDQIPLRNEPKLLPERVESMSDEGKLKASLAYREDHSALIPDDLGTAERRPRKGLIYDAPLGLKF